MRDEAEYRRRHASGTLFIGVTGSHGKSTTVELLGALLNRHRSTLTRPGPNSPPAVVRSLRYLQPWLHRYCVQELSAGTPGHLDQSLDLLRPSIGVVTAVGGDHRAAFGSMDAIAAEKARLVRFLPGQGLAVLNADDARVAAMAAHCRCPAKTFGRAAGADLRLLDAQSCWPARLKMRLCYKGETFDISTQLIGKQWCVSVLAALLAALELGVDLASCKKVLRSCQPLHNRASVHRKGHGPSYVLDTYKASFYGFESCLEFLSQADAPRRTVVVGTISDYPGSSRPRYEHVARACLAVAERVIFVGPNAARVRRLAAGDFSGRLTHTEELDVVKRTLQADQMANELIYVKASQVDELYRLFADQLTLRDCLRPAAFGNIGCRPFLRTKLREVLTRDRHREHMSMSGELSDD